RLAGGSPEASRFLRLAVAIAVAVAISASPAGTAGRVGHVGQQGELAGPLHRPGHLALMAPARAGDPTRADLAALRDEPAQHRDVLVVDLLDLVPAIGTRLTARGSLCALPIAPADRPSTLLCHAGSPARLLSDLSLERDVVVGHPGSHGSRVEIAGVGRDVVLRRPDAAGVAIPVSVPSVVTAAEELHVLSDDIDGLALLSVYLVLAPIESSVDCHRTPLLQVLPAA